MTILKRSQRIISQSRTQFFLEIGNIHVMLTNIWIAKHHFANCELKCCNLYLTTIPWLTRLRHNQKPEINYFSLSELSLNIVFVLRFTLESSSWFKVREWLLVSELDKEFNWNARENILCFKMCLFFLEKFLSNFAMGRNFRVFWYACKLCRLQMAPASQLALDSLMGHWYPCYLLLFS